MPDQTPIVPANTQPKQHPETASTAASRPTGAGVNTGAGTTRPKTEAEIEADRRYEEAMEDEYAKREGGA
ncbi:hypothetical protein N657DRAFT_638900 [Parathielavia appendiculata]|uniref:Uncharacterized protein n=1 Tax=Parathielavia appendiculata TaxID=2587402 RepID=A0AAN6U8I6_9PEZI|nr:hypothetical protein N657DRAFT_638900 [Parathielavia appendiculata]